MAGINTVNGYDRLLEIKQFDDSKIGVKGLVDSGLTSIPRFFHHPPETLPNHNSAAAPKLSVPVVDLSEPRSDIIAQIKQSSSTLGFFQIINHKIPQSTIDSIISAFKSFNESPFEVRSKYYHRDPNRGGAYSTNFDLFQSKAASWRDTVQIWLAPPPKEPECVPEVLRAAAAAEWDKEVVRFGEELMGLLEEGLGLRRNVLKEMRCFEKRFMSGHYYPYCPEPGRTYGTTSHTDPSVFTVLVQNQMGGLQVKYGENVWVDVDPLQGALVINIGDLLQMMSNDAFKSVEHRVLANPYEEPRISVAVFFNPGDMDNLYGPISDLVSQDKPPIYKQFTFGDFLNRFRSKELDGKSLTNYYRL